jgi:hypothetical protein
MDLRAAKLALASQGCKLRCVAAVQDERAAGLGVVPGQRGTDAAGGARNENRGRTLPGAPADVRRP